MKDKEEPFPKQNDLKAKNIGDILREIQQIQQNARIKLENAEIEAKRQSDNAIHEVRVQCLKSLHEYTRRNIISYYSGFLSKRANSGICHEDKNGFMMAIHKMDRGLGLDLLLHTEGGQVSATQSLVHYLREMIQTS